MNINGVSGTGMQPGMTGMGAGMSDQTDPVSKDLRRQIENLQKQLQELSANQEMPADIKMKKRQEMQKQISELEIQLRQHQMEVRREENQKKKSGDSAFDELLGTKPQERQGDAAGVGMSAGSMEALLTADASMKQAGVHGSVAKQMEGRAGVLETEIQLDQGRGGSSNIGLKEAELADTKALADQATASQMTSLAQATKAAQEAKEEEKNDQDGRLEDTSGTEEGQSIAIVEGEEQDETAAVSPQEDQAAANTFDVEMLGVAFSRGYQPVDVKL